MFFIILVGYSDESLFFVLCCFGFYGRLNGVVEFIDSGLVEKKLEDVEGFFFLWVFVWWL